MLTHPTPPTGAMAQPKQAAATTSTAPPSTTASRSLASAVLETAGLFVHIAAFSLERLSLCRLGQLTKATQALADDAHLLSGVWKGIFKKDWPREWTEEAEALLLAGSAGGGGGGGGGQAAGTGSATAAVATSTPSALPSWKALYRQRHEQTRNRPTDFMQQIYHRWSDDEWQVGSVSKNASKNNRTRGDLLTHEEMEHVAFNGFVFRYWDSDWRPSGNEVDPTSDIVVRCPGFASRDAIFEEWEVVKRTKTNKKVEAFLWKNRDELCQKPGRGEHLLYRRYGTEPEVYYSPKGYYMVAEMCRLIWFRSQYRARLTTCRGVYSVFRGLYECRRYRHPRKKLPIAWTIEVCGW